MDKEILKSTVARLTNPPKGILAADESTNTCNTRFEKVGVPTTEEKRRAYRELLITTPDIEKYISGYILYDETIRQSTSDGKSFPSILLSKGIDVGIKVDMGVKDFPDHPGEKTTSGLDGLPDRLKEYRAMGATFAKFRTVYNISENTPSLDLMKENAKILAQYALDCHTENIVPIIEPEVLIEGAHSIEKSYEVNAKNLDIVFAEFSARNIFLPGVILKNSMIISGKEAANRATPEQVAEMTVKCLKEHVPSDLGAIVFLSGGQSEEESTVHLNLMHKMGPLPWNLTFSYSRALQNSVLKHWAENPEDISGAQDIFIKAAQANSLATLGQYEGKR